MPVQRFYSLQGSVLLVTVRSRQVTSDSNIVLGQVYGNETTDERGWSRFAFRPGFINFVGDDPVDETSIISRVAAGA